MIGCSIHNSQVCKYPALGRRECCARNSLILDACGMTGCFRILGQASISFLCQQPVMVLWQIQVRYIHAPASAVEIHVSEIIYFSGLARYYVLGPQNVMCGAVQCSISIGPRVFRCSPRSENQYASRLCPFYANTSNGIVAGPSMTSTSTRLSAG